MFPFQRLDNVNGDLPDYHFQNQILADGLVVDGGKDARLRGQV
jgi:hypothetical protein